MSYWGKSEAQQAVDVVAPVMAGMPHAEVEEELQRWLDRRGAVLDEPQRSQVVDAVASGCGVVTLAALGQA